MLASGTVGSGVNNAGIGAGSVGNGYDVVSMGLLLSSSSRLIAKAYIIFKPPGIGTGPAGPDRPHFAAR